MKCNFNCLIGYALIGSMFATSFLPKNNTVFREFNQSLSPDQKYIYGKITNERFMIFLKSMILSSVIGFFTIMTFKNDNSILNGCNLATLSIGSLYILYNIFPKSDYMLNHLNSSKQNKLWLRTYKEMKMRSHLGMVLGVIGYLIVGCSI
jgi:hypothetical protein